MMLAYRFRPNPLVNLEKIMFAFIKRSFLNSFSYRTIPEEHITDDPPSTAPVKFIAFEINCMSYLPLRSN